MRLAPTNGLAYARLARRTIEQGIGKNPRGLAEADFYSRHALRLAPENPEVPQISAEIAAKLQPSAGRDSRNE